MKILNSKVDSDLIRKFQITQFGDTDSLGGSLPFYNFKDAQQKNKELIFNKKFFIEDVNFIAEFNFDKEKNKFENIILN